MKIAFYINNWNKINPYKNSTLRLIYQSFKKGHQVYLIYPDNFYFKKNLISIHVHRIKNKKKITYDVYEFFKTVYLTQEEISASTLDAILLRKAPPVHKEDFYFFKCLEDSVFFLNSIKGISITENKIYTSTQIASYIPKTNICSSPREILSAFDEIEGKHLIVKPVDSFGGKGVFKIDRKDTDSYKGLFNSFFNFDNKFVIVQEYIEEIKEGDIRMLVLDGMILGAYKRIPNPGDFRSNISAGGYAAPHAISDREREIGVEVAKNLKKYGIYFAGLDISGDKLIEVNVLAPGGIVNINKFSNLFLEKKIISFIEERVKYI